jgi:DNA polymerase III epsilon subunit-like protein
MAMKQTAIAFATTGDDPKKGHRIRELVAVAKGDEERVLHLCFNVSGEGEGKAFADQFHELDQLVGEGWVVVHNAAMWKRFLRAELPFLKRANARRMTKNVFDVSSWARRRFPRQRKSLHAIAAKAGVVVESNLSGLRGDAERLRLIAEVADEPLLKSLLGGSPREANSPMPAARELARPSRTMRERVQFCWQVLIGRA